MKLVVDRMDLTNLVFAILSYYDHYKAQYSCQKLRIGNEHPLKEGEHI